MVVHAAVADEDMRARLARAAPGTPVTVWNWRGADPARRPAEVTLLVCEFSRTPPPAAALAGLPRLGVVQIPSSGYDGWLAALPEGVLLCTGRGLHGQSTAEAALAGVLALLRRLPEVVGAQAARSWAPLATEQLSGKRVVVLGAGDVAERFARAVRALGCPTTLVGRSARAGVEPAGRLTALLPETDVLVLALPLTPSTHHLVDADLLALLPDGAVVANVARGEIVDTGALLAETAAGRLRAYLDVVDPEPLPADHPLWSVDGVLISPHTGGGSTGWRDRYADLVAGQIRRLAAGGRPDNVVGVGGAAR